MTVDAAVDAAAEGVIRYDLRYVEEPLDPSVDRELLAALDDWRVVLRRLGLVGQDPARYDGYGFGNLSARLEGGTGRRFVVSGSQTGDRARLGEDGWVLVDDWDLATHRLSARGPCRPSSEALTHAALYDASRSIGGRSEARAIVHAHAPEPWRARGALGLPTTREDVEYGTAAMAAEVARLLADEHARTLEVGVFVMAGHEDGLVAFGPSIDEAAARLIGVVERARGERRVDENKRCGPAV